MKDHGFVYELTIRALPWLLYGLLRLLFATCRVKSHGEEHLRTAMASGRPMIGAFWHYALLIVMYRMRHYSCICMVSASRDGEYIARLLRLFGYGTVRGSRHRGGVSALKELVRLALAGRNCALIADGSQGPPLQAQPGSLLVAARCNGIIVPMICTASRYWTISSWDRTLIPKPFSRVDMYFGETITVPAKADNAALENHRLVFEERLLALYKSAWEKAGKERH